MLGKLSFYSGSLMTIQSTGGIVRRGRLTGGAIAAVVAFALCAAAFSAAPANAQVRAGGHVLYKSQAFDGTFGAGGRAEVDLDFLRQGLVFAGLYDRLFPECEGCSSTEVGAHLLRFARRPDLLRSRRGIRTFVEEGVTMDDIARMSIQPGRRAAPAGIVIMPFFEFRQQFGAERLNEQAFAVGILLGPTRSRTAPRRPFGS